jgi:tRNA(Ile)-lysidine synthase
MVPEPFLVDRFRTDLDLLIAPDARFGVAVSGGSDSLALLLLAAAARPGQIDAATVDHALRPGSLGEAEMVAAICDRLGVRHAILTARWNAQPTSAIQERARNERYRLLSFWAEEIGLGAVATGHHADDQAETFLMRLLRGSGVRGLAGMRPRSVTRGANVRLIRPLLSWRRTELEQVCDEAGLSPASDPSNADEQFERVRIRRALADSAWLDAAAIARSAAYLAQADTALDWAARLEWKEAVNEGEHAITYRPNGAPNEILRRIAARALRRLASEGEAELRGAELDRLLSMLSNGETATLRGVLCRGGAEWRFSKAPSRRT